MRGRGWNTFFECIGCLVLLYLVVCLIVYGAESLG